MSTVNSTWRLAVPAVRAHRIDLVGTALVLAAAGAVVSLTGVLMESGLRGDGGSMLSALASSFAGTALVVVLIVVTSTVGLVMRQRRPELALMRTVGATASQVRGLVSTEVLLVALVAVPLGAVPGLWLASTLTPLLEAAGMVGPGYAPHLSPLPVLSATLLLAPVALVAGRLAAREAAATPPGTAVRDSVVESHEIGPVRRTSAVLLAVGGLSAALTPLLVPGVVGAASAASSAFLLVGAAACGGPLLVHAAFGRAARVAGSRRTPTTRLALANVHGFSRRLTTVVVPLALVIATGTVSTTVDRTLERAAHDQLGAAIGGDIVASSAGIDPGDVGRLADDPAVAAVTTLGSAVARVRTDPDADLPDALTWETVGLRVVSPEAPASLLDPDVTSGSLADLAEADTVSLGSDAAFELGAHVGDRVAMRLGDDDLTATVVAVHDRGLGLGSHLVGPATLAAHGVEPVTDTVVVRTADGASAEDVRSALGPDVTVRTAPDFVADSTSPDAASQRLSSVLLLALLLFVVLGAANAVVLSTRDRRRELALLARTGTTRRQLLRMVRTEALVTAGLAWLIGTLAVLPATLAVTAALLGAAVPAVHLPTYAGLSAVAFLVAFGAALTTARRVT